MISELDYYKQKEIQIKQWWDDERWKNVIRTYSPSQVANLRCTFSQQISYPSSILSNKLFQLLAQCRMNKSYTQTFGALDPVQISNMAKYLKTAYVSGWQCSSTASTTNEPGPDFADYTYDTVPNKVEQLFKALMFQDRKQNELISRLDPEQLKKEQKVDYMIPLIADADAGFGGITSMMKLTSLFIEKGAAGIHIEDQRAGTKKCGHMGGKIIVSCQEQVTRLMAARLQADIMNSNLVIIARTDALGAKFIDSNIDPIDQPHILGIFDQKQPDNLITFVQAGKYQIEQKFINDDFKKNKYLQEWVLLCQEITLSKAQNFAKENGFDFYFDWESCRTQEGYFPILGSVEFCAKRANIFLNYSDAIWMETAQPLINQALTFANLIKKYHPTKFLVYNLSPSFNWSLFFKNSSEINQFCSKLGELGYVWQFITLAGFHLNALMSEKFARSFASEQMQAYVQHIQLKENKHNVDQLTHQKWSGSEYADTIIKMITKSEQTTSNSKESTEYQFIKLPKL